MLSRRNVLRSAAAAVLLASVLLVQAAGVITIGGHANRLYAAQVGGGGGGGEDCDLYIDDAGSDSNDGSEGSPWAITALMSKSASIAGNVTCLQDGTYTVPNGYDDN